MRHRQRGRFDPCQECFFDGYTDEGAFSCHAYACPYLPEPPPPKWRALLANGSTADGRPVLLLRFTGRTGGDGGRSGRR